MRTLVRDGTHPAFATHDPPMVDACRAYADERGLTAEAFEFQMLYGVRRDLQAALRDQGYRVRIYLPFGREWFPYFMRRLGERPANVLFTSRVWVTNRPTDPGAWHGAENGTGTSPVSDEKRASNVTMSPIGEV